MKHTGQDAEIKNTLDFLTDMSNGFSQHLEEASKVTDSTVAAFINDFSSETKAEDGDQIDEKFDAKRAAAVDFLGTISGTRKDNMEQWVKAAGFSLDKLYQHALDQNNKSGQAGAKEFGKDIMTLRVGDPDKKGYQKLKAQFDTMFSESKEPELNEAKKKTSMKMEMDTNGNRVLRISSPEGSFTIQTNTNLPDIHSRKIKLDSKEAFDYVDEYLKKHGSTGKRQAVWNAYGVYSGFDKSMNESLEQLNENTKPINKKADGEFGYMAYWDKKRKLVAVYAPDTYEAKIRLMKFYKTKSTSDFSSVMKAEDDDGKQITHNANVLESAQQNLDEDSVGIPVINALKMLMAAGLKETDFKEAYGKLQDKAVSNKEYITMDNVKAVAKKYGLTLGKNVFEAYSDKNKKIDIYNDVDDMLPESLYQLDEFADVGVNDNKWQPEIEPIARGIYTFNIWKNKVKSEWYGYAYVTRNGKMLAYTTGKTRPEAILALKKLVKANSKSDTATKIDEIFGLFSGKPITPEPVETEIETWTPNLKSMGYGRYTLTFWKRKGASEWYGYVSNMRDGKMKIAYIEPESSESGIIRKLKAAVTQGVELSPVNP